MVNKKTIFKRYKRAPSDQFCTALKGPLSFIATLCNKGRDCDTNLFDLQFRRNDELAVYVGGTRIAICRYSKRMPRTIVFPKVAETYISASPALWKAWQIDDLSEMNRLEEVFRKHLLRCGDLVASRFYSNGKEGWWQNKLSIDLCRHWCKTDDLLVIDREVCIEFRDEAEKIAKMSSVVKPYNKIVTDFQEADSKRWGVPKKRPLGNEVDMIAVGKAGNLFCVELKHGSDGSKVSWGAVQVGIYGDLANEYQSDLREGAIELLEGKIKAGFISDELGARERLERMKSNNDSVETILAVAQPNPNSECWIRASEVMSALGKATPLAFVGEWQSEKPLASKAELTLLSIDKAVSSFSTCKASK